MSVKRILKGGAIAVLVLLALVGISLAQENLSVTSFVSKDTTKPGEQAMAMHSDTIKPGEQFTYYIGVENIGNGPVYDVTLTDKLPPEVAYVSNTAEKVIVTPQGGALPTDTLEVVFDVIPAGQTKSFTITVTAPTAEEPVILYNQIFLRARNVDQNIFDELKTIVMPDYDKFRAVRSLQELLINQSHLLLSFEDLLHTVSQTNAEHVTFLQSFEQLLKTQAVLISGFQTQLYSTDQSGWTNVFTNEQKIEFLMCYEELLKKEAFLFSSFEDILKKNWCSMGDINTKKEFLASFEDLLHKQVTLYSSFGTLQNRLGLENDANYTYGGVTRTGTAWKVQFLGSFETLLRLQSDLLLSFQDLMRAPCNPGIEVNKTATWSLCDDCNQKVTYTITVTNKGPNTTTGIILTDYYPKGARFSPKNNPGWIDNGDGTLSYSYGDLPGNDTSLPVTLNLFIPPALGLGPFINTVCADSNEHERVCNSVSISRTRVCPEIVVNKTGKWGDCKNGFQDAIYNITIANHGSLNATGVKLLDKYPPEATFNSGQNPDWTDNGNGTLTYNHANMLIGSTSYVTLVLNFSNSAKLGPFNNTVYVYTNEYPKVSSSAILSRDSVCPVPGLEVTKTGQWEDCKKGFQDATYTIRINNKGNTAVTGVEVLDTYPIGATFNSGQNPGWTNNGNGTLTYNHADIPSNTIVTVPLILNFSNSAGLGPFVNNVCVYTNELSRVCNSTSISRDQLCPVPEIEVTKTGQWGGCKNGFQDATYTIKVYNKGTTTVTGVKLLDTYPNKAIFNSGQNPNWTNNGNGTLTYNHADIPSNTIATITLVLGFTNNMGKGPFVNNVCVYTNELSRVCNSTSISRDSLCPVPEIEVTKTGQWGECKNGFQDATYTIRINNKGNTAVTGVKVLDTYPNKAIFNSGQNPNWTNNGNGTLTYNHADIPSNTIVTVPLILNFSNSAGLGPFVNNVCVYTNELSRVCNSTSISRDQPCPTPGLEVNKTGEWTDCNCYVNYFINVTNLGDKDALVKFTDRYPEGAIIPTNENPGWLINGDGTLTYNYYQYHGIIPAGAKGDPVRLRLYLDKGLGFGPFNNTVWVDSNQYPRAYGYANITRSNFACVD